MLNDPIPQFCLFIFTFCIMPAALFLCQNLPQETAQENIQMPANAEESFLACKCFVCKFTHVNATNAWNNDAELMY